MHMYIHMYIYMYTYVHVHMTRENCFFPGSAAWRLCCSSTKRAKRTGFLFCLWHVCTESACMCIRSAPQVERDPHVAGVYTMFVCIRTAQRAKRTGSMCDVCAHQVCVCVYALGNEVREQVICVTCMFMKCVCIYKLRAISKGNRFYVWQVFILLHACVFTPKRATSKENRFYMWHVSLLSVCMCIRSVPRANRMGFLYGIFVY